MTARRIKRQKSTAPPDETPITALPETPGAKLGDPFNPETGVFATNIRQDIGDLDELRESMRAWGWLEDHPAIKDERGVVLAGHRRLAVAEELGIEVREGHEVVTLMLGTGDEADVKRFRLAIASNLDAKPLTSRDRARIATHLDVEGWDVARSLRPWASASARPTVILRSIVIVAKLAKHPTPTL